MEAISQGLAAVRHDQLLREAAADRFASIARGARKVRARRERRDLLDELAAVPLFRGLTRRELATVARVADGFTARGGTVLAREARPRPQFVVLSQGVAEASSQAGDVELLCAGDHFGELTLLEGEPQVPNVTALTDVAGYVFGRRGFWDAIHAIPLLAVRVATKLGEDLLRERNLVPSGQASVSLSRVGGVRDEAEPCGSVSSPSSSSG